MTAARPSAPRNEAGPEPSPEGQRCQPEIFNSDQGSQFTSTDCIKVLAARDIRISMDGNGAGRDNVFVERLWRTINYEEVHLRADTSVSEARAGIGVSNSRRRH